MKGSHEFFILFLQLFCKTEIFSKYSYPFPTKKKKMHVVEQALCVSTVVGPGKERVNKMHPLLYRTHGLAGHLGSRSKGVRQDLQEDDNNLGKKWGRPE